MLGHFKRITEESKRFEHHMAQGKRGVWACSRIGMDGLASRTTGEGGGGGGRLRENSPINIKRGFLRKSFFMKPFVLFFGVVVQQHTEGERSLRSRKSSFPIQTKVGHRFIFMLLSQLYTAYVASGDNAIII